MAGGVGALLAYADGALATKGTSDMTPERPATSVSFLSAERLCMIAVTFVVEVKVEAWANVSYRQSIRNGFRVGVTSRCR